MGGTHTTQRACAAPRTQAAGTYWGMSGRTHTKRVNRAPRVVPQGRNYPIDFQSHPINSFQSLDSEGLSEAVGYKRFTCLTPVPLPAQCGGVWRCPALEVQKLGHPLLFPSQRYQL